jgi:hypothetical protein
MIKDEWGPWVEHDGKGLPCPAGAFVQAIDREGDLYDELADDLEWLWSGTNWCVDIIRYRIRKPRGLTILEGLLENLPERVDA